MGVARGAVGDARGDESEDETVYDCAIIGAGVSGLTLAALLARAGPTPRSVLLIDGARDDDALRTLSFWADGPTPFDALVRHRYRALELHEASGERVPLALERYEYRTLFFADLQRAVKSELARDARHRVVEGRAGDVEDRGDHARVTVGERAFRARWVFDSRLRRADFEVDTRRYHDVRQYFRGWLIATGAHALAEGAAHFMDFRTALPAGRAFFYVLPFGDDRTLVELVTIDAPGSDAELRRFLGENLGVRAFEVVRAEAGMSPMTEQPFAQRVGARVRAIGVAGGMLKASTGYAFARIVRDGEAIVRSLERRGHPFDTPAPRRLYRVLDGVLLELWRWRPSRMPRVFRALFARNPADRVLRFLDERASLWEIVRVGLTLPIVLFARAFARWMMRRLRGSAAR